MRNVLTEIVSGYRWPDEFNEAMGTYGLHWRKVSDRPTTRERICRAMRWGWHALMEETGHG